MAKELICRDCSTVGKPKIVTPGSFMIEIFMWCMILVPGIIYSLWRITNKKQVCKECESDSLIPITSPQGKKLLEESKAS